MKYGCIGEKLGHSFSKEIHALIADYDYEIKEIPKDELDAFMRSGDFLAINVTIPYKEAVIPYLDEIDEAARKIGAVNTIVNRGGRLFGYNTDFFGMSSLAQRHGIEFGGRKVLILGTGGTSKTAYAVAKANGAREIVKASRNADYPAVSYTDVYKYHTDAEIIINTTPVGMYPEIFGKPIELKSFPKLIGVIDAVYNPLSTPLILEAEALGLGAARGLFMLVAQAVLASEHFLGTRYDPEIYERVFDRVERDKRNIVLIGMPSSGKTTVGNALSRITARKFVDTDELTVSRLGMKISEAFETHGEAYFRKAETESVFKAAALSGSVIATGGGVILNPENVSALRENGKIYFLDRPLEMLMPTLDRPLASDRAAIEKRYTERYGLYRAYADRIIDASASVDAIAKEILADFGYEEYL